MSDGQSLEFGFLPAAESYAGANWKVEPLGGLDSTVAQVLADECCSGKWFFPPIVPDEREPTAKRRPLSPTQRFNLPSTHVLEFDDQIYDDDGVVFLLLTIGFAKGLFLLQEGWGHLTKAAVTVGQLSGFYCRPRAVVEMVERFEDLASRYSEGVQAGRTAIIGALCWFMHSQTYRLSFEEFLGQYTVMDALCNIYGKTQGGNLGSHARRPQNLCGELGVDPPGWVICDKVDSNGRPCSDLSRTRNLLVHEGLFGAKSALLGTPDEALMEDLGWFNELNRSLILALIGFSPGSGAVPVWKDSIWGEYHGFD